MVFCVWYDSVAVPVFAKPGYIFSAAVTLVLSTVDTENLKGPVCYVVAAKLCQEHCQREFALSL